jgi:hypothetical protein
MFRALWITANYTVAVSMKNGVFLGVMPCGSCKNRRFGGTWAMWPIAKSLLNRDGPKAPTAIHGTLSLKFHPIDKTNMIADCLEKQFTPHGLCDENHERWVEARVQVLLKAVENEL